MIPHCHVVYRGLLIVKGRGYRVWEAVIKPGHVGREREGYEELLDVIRA
jgi:hypothetical protein